MPVDEAEFDRQKWLPQKARKLLTLPAVIHSEGFEGDNRGENSERPVGKMTASKTKIEEMCEHFRSDAGKQELRARIVDYENSLRKQRKEKLRLAGQNFVEANRLIKTPQERQDEQNYMFDELRFRNSSACIRRNILLAERQRYYIDAKTETKELKHVRDATFSECVKDLVSSRVIYLQKAWLAKIVFAQATQKFTEAIQSSKQQQAMKESMKASRVIARLLRRAAKNRRRYNAANLLVDVLKAFAEMSRIKIFVMKLKKGVLFAQRQFRKRRVTLSCHFVLLRKQWKRLEEKQKQTSGIGTSSSTNEATKFSDSVDSPERVSSSPTSRGRQRRRTPSTPKSKSIKSENNEIQAIVEIPEATKDAFLKPWLLSKRQEYTFNCCAYEKYEIWPQLVEFVSSQRKKDGQKLFKDRRKARLFCEMLKKSGRMISYLRGHGEELRQAPRPPRFIEETVLMDFHERALAQTKAQKALAASLLGDSTSFLDTVELTSSTISTSSSVSPSSRSGRTLKGSSRGSFTNAGKKKGKKKKREKKKTKAESEAGE